jgi:hypothetical protein
MPPIREPKKKWAVVLCKLDDSNPSPDVERTFRDWFSFSVDRDRFSIADFWRGQTHGLVDVSATEIHGWHSCGWSALTPTGGSASYPGVTRSLSGQRGEYRDLARAVLKQIGRDEDAFRGVIGVFNFPVDGGAIDGAAASADIIYGLNGVAGDLSWGEGGWTAFQTPATAMSKAARPSATAAAR